MQKCSCQDLLSACSVATDPSNRRMSAKNATRMKRWEGSKNSCAEGRLPVIPTAYQQHTNSIPTAFMSHMSHMSMIWLVMSPLRALETWTAVMDSTGCATPRCKLAWQEGSASLGLWWKHVETKNLNEMDDSKLISSNLYAVMWIDVGQWNPSQRSESSCSCATNRSPKLNHSVTWLRMVRSPIVSSTRPITESRTTKVRNGHISQAERLTLGILEDLILIPGTEIEKYRKLTSGWWCNNHLKKWWTSKMGSGWHPI